MVKRSHEELAAANAAIWALLEDGADAQLRAYPDVAHVSVGAKERGGRVTRDLCIRVYVSTKRPLNALPPSVRIPREIDGVPTDVNAIPTNLQLLEDNARYRPLKGGINISNKIIAAKGGTSVLSVGTLGCTATRRSNRKPVLLSCAHVLMAHGAKKTNYIFQPGPVSIAGTPPPPQPIIPGKDNDMIGWIVDSKFDNKVDAAIAQLDVSSCCRCCGLDFKDEIAGLSQGGVPPSNKLLGMREPLPTKNVYKVGIRTGRQEGILVDAHTPLPGFPIEGVPHDFTDQISIASLSNSYPFAWGGDSGSVVVDEDGFVVGLIFGATTNLPPNDRAYANHMTDVCTALQIDLNLTGPGDASGARIVVPAPNVFDDPLPAGAELYEAARARLLAHPAGPGLLALAEAHREEIVTLVTTRRPVTVAWHRAGGPAMFASALNTLRAGAETLPVPPDGSTLDSALAALGAVLATHGSPALREAIAAHREVLLAAARDSVTLEDVLGKLDRAEFIEA